MKVQLGDGRLRVRVDEDEFAGLLAGRSATSRTTFPGGTWIVAVVATASRDCMASLDGGRLSVQVSGDALRAYQSRLPCRDGIKWTLDAGDGARVRIDFEVDVRDSIRLRGARGERGTVHADD
jgi:hypothetical protein